MVLLLLNTVLAAAPETRVWLAGEVSLPVGFGSPSSFGGGFGGLAGVSLGAVPSRSLGLEARVAEVLASSPFREMGAIEVMLRYPAGSGPYGAVGFAHHHEAPIDALLAEPVGVVAGSSKLITHRSGVALGGGWDFAAPFPKISFLQRLRPFVDLTGAWLPDRVRPNIYVFLNVGIKIGVGKLIWAEEG